MCDSRRPENGADSEYTLRPYRVLLCDRYEPEIRFEARIPAAMGPNDAKNQARLMYPGASPLKEWVDEKAEAAP